VTPALRWERRPANVNRIFWSLRRLGALSLSIISTTLVFVGVPLGVVLLIYGTVFAGASRRSRRYRPGRPFDFTPVWFLSSPELLTGAHATGHAELTSAVRPALTAAGTEWPPTETPQELVTGGASDRW
jgi:hypothetical protein